MSIESPRVADLYTNISMSKARVNGVPPDDRSMAEQLLATDIRGLMQSFSLVGIDLDNPVAQNALVTAVGGNSGVRAYPVDIPQSENLQRRLESFIEFMKPANYVVLTKDTIQSWNMNTQETSKPTGVIIYLSDLYGYKDADSVVQNVIANNISMVGMTWVVDHPVFGCAQRSTDTEFDTGLTDEGNSLVEKLMTLDQPMIFDLAHLSDKSMNDALDVVKQLRSAGRLNNKGIIYSHGGARELYPGHESWRVSQNIKDAVLQRLADLSLKGFPVLAQVMQWKGSFAAPESWESMPDFKQLLLRHVLHMQNFGLPVSLTSDWSINPAYRNQFITMNGPLGQLELFEYLKSEKDLEFATNVVKNNAHNFVTQVFS